MFKLIRRISSSVYPRPDRPWGDDATSNAPTIGRKRRMDDDDDDMHDETSTRKRRGQLQRDDTLTSELGEGSVKGKETDPTVKEVTKGVKEVELEEKAGEVKVAQENMDQVVEDNPEETPSSADSGAETTDTAEEPAALAPVNAGIPSVDDTNPTPVEPSQHDVDIVQPNADPTATPLPASDSEDDVPSSKPDTTTTLPVASDASHTPEPQPSVVKEEPSTKEEDVSPAP